LPLKIPSLILRQEQTREVTLTKEVEKMIEICRQQIEGARRGELEDARKEKLEKARRQELEEARREKLEEVRKKELEQMKDCHCLYQWYLPTERKEDKVRFKKIFGGTGSVAIYLPTGSSDPQSSAKMAVAPSQDLDFLTKNIDILPDLDLNELVEALEGNAVNASALSRYLLSGNSGFWTSEYQTHLSSLNNLHFAETIYSKLPDARVDLSVTVRPFHEYHWTSSGPEHLAHARSFSCIATLESGHLNINPTNLAEVMGISTGNSLYIALVRPVWSAPVIRNPAIDWQRR